MRPLDRLDTLVTHAFVVCACVTAYGLWMLTGFAGSVFRKQSQ